jgi:phage gp29-like protein
MTKKLRQPSKDELQGEIASIDKDVWQLLFFGGGFNVLRDGDETLRTRGGGRGLKIYTELKRDAHAAAVLDKRKRAVTAREWGVDPASDSAHDQEVADFVTQCFKRLRFDKFCKAVLEAILVGRSATEILWEIEGDRLVPAMFKKRNAWRFVLDLQGRWRLVTRERPVEGEELPDRKFIFHTHDADDDHPYGQGVGRAIFWPVFFKRQNISFWLIFNDKFGSPTALGKYPAGSTLDAQRKLLSALKAISQDAGVIVPQGMEVELLEASRAGAGDSYERLTRYCDEQISIGVLGETLTTTTADKGGTRAAGAVHQEVRMELAKDDADDLSDTLNSSIVRWIVDLNYPGSAYPTVWRNFDEPEDLNTAAERDTRLAELGYKPTPERVQRIYGDGYVKEAPPPAADPSQPPTAQLQFSEPISFWERLLRLVTFSSAPMAKARANNAADQEALAQHAEQLGAAARSHIQRRVEDLHTLLDETGDLALFRERLNALVSDAPSAEVLAALQRSGFASHLAGRLPRSKG